MLGKTAMNNNLSLQTLFQKQINRSSSDFEKNICRFFLNDDLPLESVIDEFCIKQDFLQVEEQIVRNWKDLLTINLFCALTNTFQTAIAEKVQLQEKQPWNQSSQYVRSIVALNHALAKMPIPEVGPHLLESGAALIDLHEYSPWLALPFTPQHYEFGIFLSVITLLTKRQELKSNVQRLVKWQLNTLDHSGLPLDGLFVQEKDGQSIEYFYLSYLLFRAAAILCEDAFYEKISNSALKVLKERLNNKEESIPPLWPLIEKWLEKFEIKSEVSGSLSECIHDASTALVGFRSPSQHVFCTLHGSRTGLGTLRFQDIEIVSYGPQYFPLADCEGFGIEGNALSDQGLRRSIIEWKRNAFSLKGCTRMIDQPSSKSSYFEFGQYRGIWLEVVQEFKRPQFLIETNFLGLDGWDSVAFSFFIKAQSCVLSDNKTIYPRTLDCYEGDVCPLIMSGEMGEVRLDHQGFNGQMQVIPLSGEKSFWGADFLVSYHLTSDQSRYSWNIGPVAINQL